MPRGSLALVVAAVLVVSVGCRPSGNTPPPPVPVSGPDATLLIPRETDRPDPEQELTRLEREIDKVEKEEVAIKNQLAKRIAECEKLSRNLAATRENAETAKAELAAVRDLVTQDEQTGGKRKDELLSQLAAKVKGYKALAKQIEDAEGVLKLREEEKATLFSQLQELQQVRTELRATADELEVALGARGSRSAKSLKSLKDRHQRDSSKLSEIRDGIERLQDKINQGEARIGLDRNESKKDALKEADDILGKPSK